MKRLLTLSLIANAAFVLFIGYMSLRRILPAKQLSHSFISNPQYQEQTGIFDAYKTPCKISFIGDSHIYKCHWSELLGTVVCNRGIGSDISEGVYNRITEVIEGSPEVCFICCGSNDIDLGIEPDITISYFQKIVDRLKAHNIKPVIMEITCAGEGYPNKKFNRLAQALNKRLRRLAPTISIDAGPGDLQADGIHLTGAGYEKWRQAISTYLATGPAVALNKKPARKRLVLKY